jgi:hypothetical protein
MNWMSGIKETTDNSFSKFKFDVQVDGGFFTVCEVRALAPDTANYWSWNMGLAGMPGFTTNTKTFNDGSEGHVGNPKWTNITGFWFYVSAFTGGVHKNVWIDNLRLLGGRFYDVVQDGTVYGADATSIGLYDQRDGEFKDETLDSTTDATARANTLLYKLKDPPTQVDLVTLGNTNILPGDRLSLTIPSEGITGQSFDVLSVIHTFSQNEGFQTSASLMKYDAVAGPNIRRQIKTDAIHYLVDVRRSLQQLGLNKEC